MPRVTEPADQPRWSRMGLTRQELTLWWRDMRGALTLLRDQVRQPDYVPSELDAVFTAEAVVAAWVGYEGDGVPPRPRDFLPDAIPAALKCGLSLPDSLAGQPPWSGPGGLSVRHGCGRRC